MSSVSSVAPRRPPESPWAALPPRTRWLVLMAVAVAYTALAWQDRVQARADAGAAGACG
jgi:hypothetical protein